MAFIRYLSPMTHSRLSWTQTLTGSFSATFHRAAAGEVFDLLVVPLPSGRALAGISAWGKPVHTSVRSSIASAKVYAKNWVI